MIKSPPTRIFSVGKWYITCPGAWPAVWIPAVPFRVSRKVTEVPVCQPKSDDMEPLLRRMIEPRRQGLIRRAEDARLPGLLVRDQITIRPGDPAGVHGDEHLRHGD